MRLITADKQERGAASGPNAAGRSAYAEARLRASDEARSAALEADRRVYEPDADELTTRPCGAPRGSR